MSAGDERDSIAAVRVTVGRDRSGARSREDEAAEAVRLGVLGWTRDGDGGDVLVHAEGPSEAVEAFVAYLGGDAGEAEVERVEPEGHEQFAIRGVAAGRFEVLERSEPRRGFELRLEVGGRFRAWTVPKEPSMDPAEKRMAFEAGEGAAPESAEAWDSGVYEQGGRVPWPEAIERGHAVFVLHGERLEGGFALQRIRGGTSPQWLLIKRRDKHARERPEDA